MNHEEKISDLEERERALMVQGIDTPRKAGQGSPKNTELQKGGERRMVPLEEHAKLMKEHIECLNTIRELEKALSLVRSGKQDRTKGGQLSRVKSLGGNVIQFPGKKAQRI
jgi:hypothetical protein